MVDKKAPQKFDVDSQPHWTEASALLVFLLPSRLIEERRELIVLNANKLID